MNIQGGSTAKRLAESVGKRCWNDEKSSILASQGLKWYRVDNVFSACPLIIPYEWSQATSPPALSYSAIISRKSYLSWESSILEYMEEITRMMRSHHDSHLTRRWCPIPKQRKGKREVGEMGSLEMPEWDPNDFLFMFRHVIFFLIRNLRVWLICQWYIWNKR